MNAATTYAAIASQFPASEVEWHDGWVSAWGPVPHTACNFAMAIDSDKVGEALDFVKEDRGRLLYTFTGGLDPVHDPTVRRVHRMAVMLESEAPVAHLLAELEIMEADPETIARFMAGQFFRNLTRETREQIARATACAGEELLAFRRTMQSRIVGAMMLARSEGMVGFYNLCVDSSERDRGIGRRIVRYASAIAEDEGARLTLQCDATLVPWYRDQGFRELSELHVWSVAS